MSWWEKKLPMVGAVLFRGELPPRAEEFAGLQNAGVSVKPSENNSPGSWSLELAHPEWGTAQLQCGQDQPLPPREIFDYAFIPEKDREAASTAGSSVQLYMDSRHGHVLRDRKQMLRFLRAVMGDDGVIVLDIVAQKVWTRDDLDDELKHDADLDIEGVFNIEGVRDESDKPYWIHTHGLAQIGGFDFDIFEPSEDTLCNVHELCRSTAFHVLEGSLKPSTPDFSLMYPKGDVRLVEMDYFLEHTDPARRERIAPYVDEHHRQKHSVLCEPEGGFLGRLLSGKSLQPVKFLCKGLPDNPMFAFSTTASDLMAERAQKTYPVLRALHEEFAKYPFPCMVKLGIPTDGGEPGEREHMWFEADELGEDSIEGTLQNQPYRVSGMKQGDRGRYPVSQITDWAIMTPAGMITPRSMAAARILREMPEELTAMLDAMKKAAEEE